MKTLYLSDSWPRALPICGHQVPKGRVQIALPGRVDFMGGWTDTPPWERGAVLNASLALSDSPHRRDAEPLLHIEIDPAPTFTFIENGAPREDWKRSLILPEILRFLHLEEPPLRLTLSNAIPPGSGLGGSSLLTAGLLSAFLAYYHGAGSVFEAPEVLVNAVLAIEQFMGCGGGWQDQIGGIVGGIKLITTDPDRPGEYRLAYVESDALDPASLILDTGIRRRARKILESIVQKVIRGDQNAAAMLGSIAEDAEEGLNCLRGGNIATFGRLMEISWNRVNAVEGLSYISLIDEVKRWLGNRVLGTKLPGAGGGGFIFMILQDERARTEAVEILKAHFPEGRLYFPRFGVPGLRIRQGDEVFQMGTPALLGRRAPSRL